MQHFKKVISAVLALTLALTLISVSVLAAPVPASKQPAYTVQMLNQTLTLFKDNKPFLPYQLSTANGKNGITMKQSADGNVLLSFIESTGKNRSINIGKENNIELKGTFPSFKVDRSVNNITVALSTHDKTDPAAMPTVVKELVVRGAIELNVAPNATIAKVQISNSRASVNLEKGAQVKKIEASAGVKVGGTGKNGVKVDRPAASTPSGGSDSGSNGGGSNTPNPPVGTKVTAPIVTMSEDEYNRVEFTLSDLEDIESVNIATSEADLADGGSWGYEADILDAGDPAPMGIFEVFAMVCDSTAGNYTLYFQSAATEGSGRANSDIVTYKNTYKFTTGSTLDNLTYETTTDKSNNESTLVVTVTGGEIKKGAQYYIVADCDSERLLRSKKAEKDGTISFDLYDESDKAIQSVTIYKLESSSYSGTDINAEMRMGTPKLKTPAPLALGLEDEPSVADTTAEEVIAESSENVVTDTPSTEEIKIEDTTTEKLEEIPAPAE